MLRLRLYDGMAYVTAVWNWLLQEDKALLQWLLWVWWANLCLGVPEKWPIRACVSYQNKGWSHLTSNTIDKSR